MCKYIEINFHEIVNPKILSLGNINYIWKWILSNKQQIFPSGCYFPPFTKLLLKTYLYNKPFEQKKYIYTQSTFYIVNCRFTTDYLWSHVGCYYLQQKKGGTKPPQKIFLLMVIYTAQYNTILYICNKRSKIGFTTTTACPITNLFS